MAENIENKVNSYVGFRKLAGASILGALCFVGGYNLARYTIPSIKEERVQAKNYSQVPENSLEKKAKEAGKNNEIYFEFVTNSVKGKEKSVQKLDDNLKSFDKNDNNLEKKIKKYSDVFSYVRDENSGDYELRMKTDKLNKKEISEFISMKGTIHNKEKGYIFFGSRFENREFYNSMKDLAILYEVDRDGKVSDEEKKFVKENAPNAYKCLFPFERSGGFNLSPLFKGSRDSNLPANEDTRKKDNNVKSEIKSEDKREESLKKKDYNPKDHPFLTSLFDVIKVILEARQAEEFSSGGSIDVLRMFGNSNSPANEDTKIEVIKTENPDEAPKASKKYQ